MTDFFNHLILEFKFPLQNPILIFSLILLIILLSPIVLKKLKIPGIIGLIISGVIIGPDGLNMLEKNSAINLFSTIGLLYIMFIAGLELDMNEFRANRNKSLVFGFFTFIIPLSIGFPVCFYFLNYDFNASFLTASMFATHTLIAYPIVSKLGISKHQAVAVTVGGTILTDTAVLIILAVIMGKQHGTLNQEFWIRLGISLAIFSVIMFLVIPRIAKWFFRKLESEKHSHYIFVLSVVFFAAFLSQVAGVEPIIGAFMAGLALNKLIPHSSALMNRIEFIGNSLFIPFFLISVGMLVNVKILLNGPEALIVAATLSVVALLGKWAAAFLTQICFKYTRNERQLIFGLSSSHAAATLAIILVGFNAKILDEKILNGTIILILVTCIVASFATEKAAKEIVIAGSDNLPNKPSGSGIGNEHILLTVEDFESFEKVLELSVMAKEKNSVNPLSILSVVTNNDEAEKNIIKTRKKLEEYISHAAATETRLNLITTIDHNVASGISRVSREIMASMIILNWPQRSDIFDKLMGEKMEMLLHYTDKTIVLCDLQMPLVMHKKMVIAAPPLTEKEYGFEQWLLKTAKIAQELSMPIQVHCNPDTKRAIEQVAKMSRFSAIISTVNFEDWEDFVVLARHIRDEDLFVLVSARRGSVSYINQLEGLPAKIAKHFARNNKLIIYPGQNDTNYPDDNYDDISAEPLIKSIEAVQKIGKGIASIFKNEKNEVSN